MPPLMNPDPELERLLDEEERIARETHPTASPNRGAPVELDMTPAIELLEDQIEVHSQRISALEGQIAAEQNRRSALRLAILRIGS